MFVALLHLLVGLLGFSLLYAALFLHENEEGQLQNRLEKLWVAVDDLSKIALSKQTAFLQQVSSMANSALNKLFGARLFSLVAVSTSLCFSFGSFLLLELSIKRFLYNMTDPHRDLLLVASIIATFGVGLLPIPFRYIGFPWVFGFVSLALYVKSQTPPTDGGSATMTEDFLAFATVLVGGFVSDILFIALSRWCLRRSSELKNGWKIAGLVSLNGCVGLSLIAPVFLQIIRGAEGRYVESEALRSLIFLGASNLVTGVIALLFVALALAALLHLAVWPILERPIYSLQRFGVARQPKLLAAASVTCLLFAWPNSPIIHGITKLIHGG